MTAQTAHPGPFMLTTDGAAWTYSLSHDAAQELAREAIAAGGEPLVLDGRARVVPVAPARRSDPFGLCDPEPGQSAAYEDFRTNDRDDWA